MLDSSYFSRLFHNTTIWTDSYFYKLSSSVFVNELNCKSTIQDVRALCPNVGQANFGPALRQIIPNLISDGI